MKLRKAIYISAMAISLGWVVGCSNDDNAPYMNDDDGMMGVDFSGTYAQVDHLGRPGINTTLSFDMEGEASIKDAHNTTIPSEMTANFQAGFQARLEQYHDVYALKLGLDPAAVDYENNILGLDAATLTTVLAADVLEVSPDLPTTYFNPGTDFDNDGRILVPDGDEVALTGRHPNDDIIDVSLILFFGGMEGTRFSGQDLDDDGMADLPRLTSDGVGLTATISTTFPYLGNPE
ncbi:DUF4331 domain-containing protein [Flagellimonas taeanensis]|uniref:DUF4331 domain-containing protein n=1 Tax=Flagellimonas taeanensis TaxID=1005926 RepID=A0A1M7AGM7_9FLAO|nr:MULTISPECIES: DUF4331 family protein [Allomuricauda]MDC6384778.1 DUF4331 family protein [Muricauda sp. SK9]MEE1962638.1 DUF4331 family protein [Allomuricauda taeanensis]RIV53487.1 DUF4331 domain-containing protein [Allomuricauda taeanensis]SFC33538.1 protein of unknown function [Allomuricauda taeanensis]SHL41951.1 protein of unknown function [Allomuricauda taeanensis]